MDILSENIKSLLEPSIFYQIRKWSVEYNALDISSGKPNWKIPTFLQEAIKESVQQNQDQYGIPGGLPALKQQIYQYIKQSFRNLQIDPQTNIYIGNGASGVLFDLVQTLLNPGDEIVFFDPHFPHFKGISKIVGATIKTSKLIPPKDSQDPWAIDFGDFKQQFTEKTKVLILCNPNNPTGKIFTKEEYKKISQILEKFPKIQVISDDVYDFLVYDQKSYTRFTDISPEMAERTITVGSLGKLLGCTGWRSGYAIAKNEYIIKGLVASCANNYYCTFSPAQQALIQSLDEIYKPYKNSESYLKYTLENFQNNRDLIVKEFTNLKNFNWQILQPEGGYFIMINIEKMIPEVPLKYFYKEKHQDKTEKCAVNYADIENPDYSADCGFTKYLLENYQITVLPTYSLNMKPEKNNFFVRISLSKTPQTILQAIKQLQK